jgi:hypothetical protein
VAVPIGPRGSRASVIQRPQRAERLGVRPDCGTGERGGGQGEGSRAREMGLDVVHHQSPRHDCCPKHNDSVDCGPPYSDFLIGLAELGGAEQGWPWARVILGHCFITSRH